MLIEKLPDVQSLPLEEKWLLIEELWQEVARQVESTPADADVVKLLEARFADYLADPSQASPAETAFERLAERKRTWK